MKMSRIRQSLIASLVLASGTAALAQAARNQPAPRLSGFSVVMVEGGPTAASTVPPEAIPQAAARALADLKEFLTYKSFRLLDTLWIRGSGKQASQLRGPSGERFDLLLVGYQPGGTDAPSKVVGVQQFQLSRDGRPVIHTSFQMEVGETVVVGTSHLQGDKALIVLLTAVAR